MGRGMNWIDLAQERDRRRALVNVVIEIWFRNMWGISGLAESRLASQRDCAPWIK
jgi:hypothetical protein